MNNLIDLIKNKLKYDLIIEEIDKEDFDPSLLFGKIKELSNKACANDPVQDHYNLGLMFNVQGTPTMLTDKGEMIVGYMPAATLRARLDSQ